MEDYQLELIFKGIGALNQVSQFIGYLQQGTDVIQRFANACTAYCAALGYLQTKEHLYEALLITHYEINRFDPDSAKLFKKSLDKYMNVETKGDVLMFALKQLRDELTEVSASNVYSLLFEKVVQNGIYNFVGGILHTSAGTLGFISFTYNTTFKILDYVSGMGKKSELYKLMYAISRLETGMLAATKYTANQLLQSPTQETAEKFGISNFKLAKIKIDVEESPEHSSNIMFISGTAGDNGEKWSKIIPISYGTFLRLYSDQNPYVLFDAESGIWSEDVGVVCLIIDRCEGK